MGARRRSRSRGTTTLETMWVIVAFAIPTTLMLSAWGLHALSEYRTARSYVFQAFP